MKTINTKIFIPIVFITDDNYIIPTAVAIQSLIENKKPKTKYNIFVVSTCLSDKNTNNLKKLVSKTTQIHVIQEDVNKLINLHKYEKTGFCQATPSALLKFKLPDIFKRYNKIIYLDGDIIVKKDLSDLYFTDLEDNFVAAVHDTGKLYSNRPILQQIPEYFNSGVMLLNLKKLRLKNMPNKLIKLKKQSKDMSLMDQNILNIGLKNNVKILDIKYNFLTINLHRAINKFNINDLNKLFNSKYRSLEEIENKAYILHFASKDKPWKYVDGPYSEEWYKYFIKTPYSHCPIQRTNFNTEYTQKKQIIISLTSYPARIKTVNQTIKTLLNQTMKADKVILWLAPEQFPNREKDLPKKLLNLKNKGLTIDWYHDIRSYKKLIPTLQKYPDAIIVTADDDIVYPDFWLKSLYDCYLTNQDIIWCHRAHKIQMKNNQFLPYKNWQHNIQTKTTIASYTNFCTTGGGVLYPPKCFFQDVLNENIFMKLTPNADDIWFWGMLILNNKKIQTVEKPMGSLTLVDGTQETALWHQNINGGENDKQIANLVKKYPEILKVLDDRTTFQKIKPYLFFPYYLIAILWMKIVYIPSLKFLKHIRAILYSHSYRGKMDMLNKNFRAIFAELQSIKKDLKHLSETINKN